MALPIANQLGAQVLLPLYDGAYSCSFKLTAAQTATPTTLFQFQGFAAGVARIKYFQVNIRSGSAASSAGTIFTINRRTATATGGTSAAPTIIKHDTNNAAVQSSLLVYTAFPTVGTGGGIIRQFTATLAGTAADNTNQLFTYQWVDKGDQPLLVRGVADFITLELAVALSTAQNLEANVEWDEATT